MIHPIAKQERGESALPQHKPSLAFLGVGWIGRHRMEAVANSQLARIAAIADPSLSHLNQAQALAPDARLYSDMQELLSLREVEGLVIASPSALHAGQCLEALQAGKAVFCQKPLGRNAAETAQVVQTARQYNRLLGVDLSYRYSCFDLVRQLVQSGELGEIYAVELVFHNAYGPDKAWFYDPQLSGGGCVIDLGIHLIDMALWALGYPAVQEVTSKLYAKGRPLKQAAAAVEDYATACISVDSGAVLQMSCSWNLPAGKEADIQANFYGSKGGAAFRNLNGSFYDFTALRFYRTITEELFAGPDDWGGRAILHWVEQLGRDGSFDEEAQHLVTVAQVLDKIYQC